MKFTLFRIEWDFTPVVGMIWAFVGLMLIGLTFALPSMPWYVIIIYATVLVVYLATAQGIAERLTRS